MELFENDFNKTYDTLSELNEGDNTQLFCASEVVGWKGNSPILKANNSELKTSLLDYIDIDATKRLNPTIDEDSTKWIVNTAKYVYVVRCPNKNCLNHNGSLYTKRGTVLWRLIKQAAAATQDREMSVEELLLCSSCMRKANKNLMVGTKLSQISGFENGQVIISDTNTLFDYLDIEGSLKLTPHLEGTDPRTWSAFDRYCKYSFRCPICGSLVSKTSQTLFTLLRRTKDAEESSMTVRQILSCASCANRTSGRSTTILDIPEVWNRVPEYLFIDKTAGISAQLSDRGYSILYELNKEQGNRKLPRNFLNMLSSREPNFKPVKFFTEFSEIVLPFICDTPECGLEYTSTITNACHATVSHGCPACMEAAVAGTSYSEIFLRETVQEVLGVEIVTTPKEGRFRPIDILFKYKGKLIGIEYDGGCWHSQNIVEVDIRKTQLYKEKYNIDFIRVREKGSANFPKELACIIDIKNPFIRVNKAEYFSVMELICDHIGYRLTDDDYDKLLSIYKERSQVNNIKQKALSRIKNND